MYQTLFIRLSIKTVPVALIVLIFSINATAQWQQLTGLKGEPVYWIRQSPGNIYSITGNGGLSSANNGASWADVPEFYQTNSVERLSVSGDTIVTFSFPDLLISTDDGVSWNTMQPPPTTSQITDVLIYQNTIVVATEGDYAYYSSNTGASWNQATGFTTPYVNFLSGGGNTIQAATEDGVFISQNQGASFTQTGLAGESVTRIYANGNYVFTYSTAGIHKSSDAGSTWVPFQTVLPVLEITDFCLSGDKVFAAAYDMLLVSDTIFSTWSQVTFNQNITFIFSVCMRNNTVFASTNRGVFSSTNQGISWTESNDGITPVNVEALTMLNDTLFAGANIYGVSDYSGSGWAFAGLGLRNCNDLITRGSDLYSASDFGIYKSSNSGGTWSLINAINPPVLVSYCTRVDVADSLIVSAALQNGIMRSGDYGSTWSFQASGLSGALVSSVAISGSNIIVGTYSNGLFTSTDGGFTWNPTGAAGQYIADLTTIGNNVLAAAFGGAGNFLSTDNGSTWNLGPTNAFEDLSTAGNIILGSSQSYIMLSLDSGQTFQNLVAAPGTTQIVGSLVTATDVYIGTSREGVWKTTISEILSTPELQAAEHGAWLFPNAFRNETTIVIDDAWTAARPEFRITDISGRVVKKFRLSNARTPLSGNGLNSGVYFYSVQDDTGNLKSGKLIVY